ncbi:hypothetical protein ACFSUS_13840 [Spirosoma soli]|uniref:Uncharacterized protein n=1 Tax=Spirosoma soli TaxID=1770529 RepID=A0ABW5M3Y5_9BACT
MNNTFDSYDWHNSLNFRWIALPVLAHLFSSMTGIGGIFLFPIFITVAQYLIFKIHPAIGQPGIWFVTLPVTFYIWIKWGPFMTYTQPDGIVRGVLAYYAGQLINAFFIPLIIKPGRPELLLNWLVCTSITALIWVGLYWLIAHSTNLASKDVSNYGFSQFILYPAIALVANSISSFFLLKE